MPIPSLFKNQVSIALNGTLAEVHHTALY